MITPIPTMTRKAKNGAPTGGRWSAGHSLSPLIAPFQEWVRMRLPRFGISIA